jgi:hypothetical protein
MTNAHLAICTDDWSQGPFYDRDGSAWMVKGECDQERCGAVCCKVANFTGKVGQPCVKLTEDLLCQPHRDYGQATKPVSCLFWPLRQADVEKVNELAERLGYDKRCHLEVISWQP